MSFPTQEQAAALVKFAEAKGHQWKSRLRNYWGCTALNHKPDPLLQQVRNSMPSLNWLMLVKLEDLRRIANPPVPDIHTAEYDTKRQAVRAPGFLACADPDGTIGVRKLNSGNIYEAQLILDNEEQLDHLLSALCCLKNHLNKVKAGDQ